MLTIQISLVIIAVCTLLLTIVPLLIAFQVYRMMRSVTKVVKEFQEDFKPLTEEIKEFASHATEVADNILVEVEGFTEAVAGVRERAERMGLLAEVLEEDLERVTIKMFSFFGGIGRFVKSLFRKDSGGKSSGKKDFGDIDW
ncbi:DUF948 domain-containing protein [Gemmatimonadota bacterium]